MAAIRHHPGRHPALSGESSVGSREGNGELRLLERLQALDQPEGGQLALAWLQAGPSPQAVAMLGHYLAAIAPGVHDASIRTAAEQALVNAASLDALPGELFQLLGEYGDSGTVNLLVDMPWHQDAYASTALALIPDGSGLDLLIQDALLFEQGRSTTHGRLAIELLAQRAHQDPGAASALIELAEQRVIPVDIWPDLLAAVAGAQSISMIRPNSGLLSVQTILRPGGTQTLFRVALSRTEDDSQEFRRALLEELLIFAPRLPGAAGSVPCRGGGPNQCAG